jgi:hypothetical protein
MELVFFSFPFPFWHAGIAFSRFIAFLDVFALGVSYSAKNTAQFIYISFVQPPPILRSHNSIIRELRILPTVGGVAQKVYPLLNPLFLSCIYQQNNMKYVSTRNHANDTVYHRPSHQ